MAFQDHSHQKEITVAVVAGDVAPRYSTTVENLKVTDVVVTEQATASGLPCVDFQLVDDQGRKFFAVMTGRQVTMVAAVVAGVNMRIHGRVDV